VQFYSYWPSDPSHIFTFLFNSFATRVYLGASLCNFGNVEHSTRTLLIDLLFFYLTKSLHTDVLTPVSKYCTSSFKSQCCHVHFYFINFAWECFWWKDVQLEIRKNFVAVSLITYGTVPKSDLKGEKGGDFYKSTRFVLPWATLNDSLCLFNSNNPSMGIHL
jgi:hypothetical protein